MSKRAMVQWLTELLIRFGTEPFSIHKLGLVKLDTHYKCVRLGYINHTAEPVLNETLVNITKEGIAFLEENDK